MNIPTLILAGLIFGIAIIIIVNKVKKGLFSSCSDCDCSCPVKPESLQENSLHLQKKI